jgi:hypothetical protein
VPNSERMPVWTYRGEILPTCSIPVGKIYRGGSRRQARSRKGGVCSATNHCTPNHRSATLLFAQGNAVASALVSLLLS